MIVIINTGIGNFKSIQNMLGRIGVSSTLTHDADTVAAANKIILPGIGSFDRGMAALKAYGLVDVIKDTVINSQTKILGICLGMQMLSNGSEEGNQEGLALIKGTVKKFSFSESMAGIKIPHMGWNYAIARKEDGLFKDFEIPPRFYFTHSYYYDCEDISHSAALTRYGIDFTSAVQKKNIYGVQFHPEKSHRFGFHLLKNFALC